MDGSEYITRERAIPACAGRTGGIQSLLALLTGHPRVCGENATGSPGSPRGSSGHPRVCGENTASAADAQVIHRAIPACAGRTDHQGGPCL